MKRFFQRIVQHRGQGLRLAAYVLVGAVTGVACVGFMRAFEFVFAHRLDAARLGPWAWLAVPLLFVLAVELVRRLAPHADGAGIPQAIFAATHLTEASVARLRPLVSMRTMLVKAVALLLGVWAGASTGREGPTVHIAACLFFSLLLAAQRLTRLKFDLRSGVIAGGAAGLAAAFNTPLAGVTFAIEELSGDHFTSIKEAVLMAIIVAGIAAKSLTGEYAYFGRLATSAPVTLRTVLAIGLAGGFFGALFSTALIKGRQATRARQAGAWRYTLPAGLALGLLAVNHASALEVLGPGNEAAQALVAGQGRLPVLDFPLWKMAATLFTYWSGIAGGIFAPSLSMGAGLGADIGYWLGDPIGACAMIGMAAFLAGAIQAPMTAFVIIFEMTGHHQMLLPIMLASLVAVLTARMLGARHLYQALAASYTEMLEPRPAAAP